MTTEYILYADESVRVGQYYSNFFAGALVRSPDLLAVETQLKSAKTANNLLQEVKWTKVTEQYLPKYVSLMDTFFELVAADRVKVRVMFTQNANRPQGLEEYHLKNAYQLLYYQFIKHAFGLPFSNPTSRPIRLRIYLDQIPLTNEKVAQFRGHLASLEHSQGFRDARILVPPDQIASVDSRHHVVLQCVDVVLGAMQFRLNDVHRHKPPGEPRRSKRTLAKEKLYEHISANIRRIYPRFNIGVTTSERGDRHNRWRDPYRHWLFQPSQSTFDPALTKRKR